MLLKKRKAQLLFIARLALAELGHWLRSTPWNILDSLPRHLLAGSESHVQDLFLVLSNNFWLKWTRRWWRQGARPTEKNLSQSLNLRLNLKELLTWPQMKRREAKVVRLDKESTLLGPKEKASEKKCKLRRFIFVRSGANYSKIKLHILSLTHWSSPFLSSYFSSSNLSYPLFSIFCIFCKLIFSILANSF